MPVLRRHVQVVADPPMTGTAPLPAALQLAAPQPPAVPEADPARVPVTVPAAVDSEHFPWLDGEL
jgi:hypothetical protein